MLFSSLNFSKPYATFILISIVTTDNTRQRQLPATSSRNHSLLHKWLWTVFIWALTFSLPLEHHMTSGEDCFLFAYLMSCYIPLEFRLFFFAHSHMEQTFPYEQKPFCFGRQFSEEIRTCSTNSLAGKGLEASGSVYLDFFLSLQLTFSRTLPNFLAASTFSLFIMRWVNKLNNIYLVVL